MMQGEDGDGGLAAQSEVLWLGCRKSMGALCTGLLLLLGAQGLGEYCYRAEFKLLPKIDNSH